MKTLCLLIVLGGSLGFTAATTAQDADKPAAEKPAYAWTRDIMYRPDLAEQDEYAKEKCVLDVYYPSNRPGFATVVWFHGGGLYSGHRGVPLKLREQGIAVVSVEYRLSPQVSSPAWIEDAAAAVAWTFENIAGYGGDAEAIYVAGHSAGGYLTSMVGLDKRWLAAHDLDADRIAGLAPYSGHTITHFTVRKERGIPRTQPIVDDLAPLYHVRPDAPPVILTTGDRELELMGRYEENAYMVAMMKAAGHQDTVLHEIQGHNHIEMVRPSHRILLKHIRQAEKARRETAAPREPLVPSPETASP
ncbi:MAG: alpha/beta hydrolase fold domain-containing protein [Planctomycetota bacterium]